MIDTNTDDYTAADIDRWMALEGVDEHDLTALFNNTVEYQDALANYCDDFHFSAEYEMAYECWLATQINK